MRKILGLILLFPIALSASWKDPDSNKFFARLNPLWSWCKARAQFDSTNTGEGQLSPTQKLHDFIEHMEVAEQNWEVGQEVPCRQCTLGVIEQIVSVYEESLLNRNLLTRDDIALLEQIKIAARARRPDEPSKSFFETKYKGNIHDEGTSKFGIIERVDEVLRTGEQHIVRAASLPKMVCVSSIVVGLIYFAYLDKNNLEADMQAAAHHVQSAGNVAYHVAGNAAQSVGHAAQSAGHAAQNVLINTEEKIDDQK